ncbi:TIGR03085 family protein [Corynebacterium poyangense]|uniref:TIGR03085 family protein n=1 Tax=Corynebacterium poyangense TaxID=2684405 RepID=A0A7H0SPE3_9CORY|nr:TIGR03085 family metal-binding protein [Corynebacterium poyangense]QNQ90418.1 TIGR03085 family protein [Corynebacterium poyangense]
MSFAATERERLADMLLRKGPSAPTLCEGWTTQDLAMHLFLRENRPDAAVAIFFPALASYERKVKESYQHLDYEELVNRWRRGPQRYNPIRFLDSLINTSEHFIHFEDVRRAEGDWEPREFSAAVNDSLVRILRLIGVRLLSQSAAPIHLVPTGYPPITAADTRRVAQRGDNGVHVFGDPGELLLFATGRDAVDIRIDGDANLITRSSL